MNAEDHLAQLEEQHRKEKKPGCIWRHARGYEDAQSPACSHRKNAHDYALLNERDIFNIPNPRVPQGRINAFQSRLPERGGWGPRAKKLVPLQGRSWDLDQGGNFRVSATVPYWHNAHHLIACGEVTEAFTSVEVQIILATRWNINKGVNSVLLPKQPEVARLMKLPTHVPPDGKQSHDGYSEQVGAGLGKIKRNLTGLGEDGQAHPVTTKTAPACVSAFDNCSKHLREYLFDAGEETPGINLSCVDLSKFNWLTPGR